MKIVNYLEIMQYHILPLRAETKQFYPKKRLNDCWKWQDEAILRHAFVYETSKMQNIRTNVRETVYIPVYTSLTCEYAF